MFGIVQRHNRHARISSRSRNTLKIDPASGHRYKIELQTGDPPGVVTVKAGLPSLSERGLVERHKTWATLLDGLQAHGCRVVAK